MIRPQLRKLARRLAVLCALSASLLAVTYGPSATADAKSAALICCSACEVENPPLACRRGCSPSCVVEP